MLTVKEEAEKAALIALIGATFDGVERGDGVTLHEADIIDAYGSDEERAAARLLDTDTRWQDVPHDDISRHSSALGFLDPKGFRYYAPAYMVWYLTYRDIADETNPAYSSMSYDSLLSGLAVGFDDGLRDYQLERFRAFTVPESTVIARFLAYLSARITDEPSESDEWYEELRREAVASGNLTEAESRAVIEGIKQSSKPGADNEVQRTLDSYWSSFFDRLGGRDVLAMPKDSR